MDKLSTSGELLYPPSINKLWMRIGNRVVKSPRAQKYVKDSVDFLNYQRLKPILLDRVMVEIDVYPPDKRIRDLDNIMKLIFDVLVKAAIIKDDFHVQKIIIQRCDIMRGGNIKFRITEM
jgi:crossover junction endodeoxyribonuclease RusA